jgi:hypothetical protein
MVMTYEQVYDSRGEVLALVAQALHMRPSGIGVIEVGGGRYGLEVLLPEAPGIPAPAELRGVPIRYAVAAEPAVLLGGKAAVPEWRRRVRAAGR